MGCTIASPFVMISDTSGLSTLVFAALAGLSLESIARRAQDPDDTVEDTSWTSVRLVVLKNHYTERCELSFITGGCCFAHFTL